LLRAQSCFKLKSHSEEGAATGRFLRYEGIKQKTLLRAQSRFKLKSHSEEGAATGRYFAL